MPGLAVSAPQVGVYGAALDGSGADQGDLDDQVVEGAGFESGQGGQLGAGLDLEHPDGVGLSEHGVHGVVGQVEVGQVDGGVFVFGDEVDGVVQGGEHAQAEQVELDQADRGAVVLVPLHISADQLWSLKRLNATCATWPAGNQSVGGPTYPPDHGPGANMRQVRPAPGRPGRHPLPTVPHALDRPGGQLLADRTSAGYRIGCRSLIRFESYPDGS